MFQQPAEGRAKAQIHHQNKRAECRVSFGNGQAGIRRGWGSMPRGAGASKVVSSVKRTLKLEHNDKVLYIRFIYHKVSGVEVA